MEERALSYYVGEPAFDYVGKNVLFALSVNNIPESMLEAGMQFELAFYCHKGKFQAVFEGKEYKVEAGQILIYTEDRIIHEFLTSGDAEITIVGYTWDIIEDTRSISMALWPMVDYVMGDAVIKLSNDHIRWLEYLLSHMKSLCASENMLFKDELMQTWAQALLYEFIRLISNDIRSITPKDTSRSNEIVRTFFDILATRHGRMRSVSKVAEMMNLSPKYLSRIIKKATGEKPMFHIHEYMMRAIDQELRYTDKTIKEIAFQQRFPSLAFFGKFVKQQTGMSPSDYRNKIRNEQMSFAD